MEIVLRLFLAVNLIKRPDVFSLRDVVFLVPCEVADLPFVVYRLCLHFEVFRWIAGTHVDSAHD